MDHVSLWFLCTTLGQSCFQEKEDKPLRYWKGVELLTVTCVQETGMLSEEKGKKVGGFREERWVVPA